jgi:hypothetical protein
MGCGQLSVIELGPVPVIAGRRRWLEQGAVIAAAVALGIGVGWPADAGLVTAAVILSAGTVCRSPVVAALMVVPVLAWAKVPWPAPAAVAVLVVFGLRWLPAANRRDAVGLLRAWTSALIVSAASIAVVIPVAMHQLARQPLVLTFDRPALPVLALAIVGIAVVNSASEEALWRVVIYRAGQHARLTMAITIAVQSASFGFAHRHGLPGGVLGVGLAALFAAAITCLRRYGFRYALLTHLAVDLALFTLAARTAQYGGHTYGFSTS